MSIRAKFGRTVAALGLAIAGIAGSLATAAPASAEPIFPIDWNIDATTNIKKLGIEQEVTGGSFVGSADLGTGAITGNLTLPPASMQFAVLGLNLADVGFAVVPTGPVTGTVDLATLNVSMTSSFNIKIPYLRPLGLRGINLVGNNCQTSTPINLTMGGPVDLANGSTLSGEFTIPKFKNCGLLTFALNLLIPGEGNTFTAAATPKPAA